MGAGGAATGRRCDRQHIVGEHARADLARLVGAGFEAGQCQLHVGQVRFDGVETVGTIGVGHTIDVR